MWIVYTVAISLFIGFLPMGVRFLILPLFDKKEEEPYIPTAMEDWDTDFERLTGKQVPGASHRTTGKYSGLIRGSFNTILRPGLRKALTLPEPTEEIFNEALDETVSFHPDTKGPDAEW